MGREIRDYILWQVNGIRFKDGKSPLFLHEELSDNAQKHAKWLLDPGLWKKPNLSNEARIIILSRGKTNMWKILPPGWDGDSLEGIVGKMIKSFENSSGYFENIVGNFIYFGAEIACNSGGLC